MLLTLLTFILLKELLKANIPLHSTMYLKWLSRIPPLEKKMKCINSVVFLDVRATGKKMAFQSGSAKFTCHSINY